VALVAAVAASIAISTVVVRLVGSAGSRDREAAGATA